LIHKGFLSLAEAKRTGRLAEFVAQEEARGVPAADVMKLDTVLAAAVKPQRSKRQTSRSASRGGSGGK
jgi:hypothetical protein